MADTPDAELLEQFRQGSGEAFNVLVERYLALVHSVALRHTANSRDAQDITQAVFIVLARKAGSLGRGTVLPGWLYRTAWLTAANYQRAEVRRIHREQEVFMQSTLQEPATDALWQELSPKLDTAMASLGASERNALVLRYFQNKSIAEVGACLGLQENTAQKRVSRALEKLRKFFSKHGVLSTTAIIAGAISSHSVQAAPVGMAKTISAIGVAKGAAASASTLTLVKGALKMMTWTKIQMTVAAAVGVFLVAGTAIITVQKIVDHEAYPWRVENPSYDLITKAPPMLKILPTKFSKGNLYAYGMGRGETKLLGIDQSVEGILCQAYPPWRPARILSMPSLPAGNYDYIDTLPRNSISALQAAVKKKFGIVAMRQTIVTNALLLVIRNPDAPGLKASRKGSNANFYSNVTMNSASYSYQSGSISDIADVAENKLMVPVIDQTGLTGRIDFDLKWTWKDNESENDALREALLNELGLDLVPTNMPIEMLVVEKVK